jgi:hypothetical protein
MDSISSLANGGEETGWSKKAEVFLSLGLLYLIIDADMVAVVYQAFALSARKAAQRHVEIDSGV